MGETIIDEVTEIMSLTSKNHPPLSTLHSPSWEFLHNDYTKNVLQKYCSQLQLGGIWTTKEKLIDKLMLHYSNQRGSQLSTSTVAAQASSSGTSSPPYNQGREHEDSSLTELLGKFESFVRETNDNFYVVNNTLVERERNPRA